MHRKENGVVWIPYPEPNTIPWNHQHIHELQIWLGIKNSYRIGADYFETINLICLMGYHFARIDKFKWRSSSFQPPARTWTRKNMFGRPCEKKWATIIAKCVSQIWLIGSWVNSIQASLKVHSWTRMAIMSSVQCLCDLSIRTHPMPDRFIEKYWKFLEWAVRYPFCRLRPI